MQVCCAIHPLHVNVNTCWKRCNINGILWSSVFQNGPLPLLRITVPAIVMVLFCPLLLVKADVFKDLFWNGSGDDKVNVNDALGVFLVPVSLLFALMFSVSFEYVLGKQSEVRILINREVRTKQVTIFGLPNSFVSIMMELEIFWTVGFLQVLKPKFKNYSTL